MALHFEEVCRTTGVEHQVGSLGVANRHEDESVGVVQAFEYEVLILKVEDAREGVAVHESLEVLLRVVVGGDTAWHDESGSSSGAENLPVVFREEGVGVDPALSAQREATATTREVDLTLGRSLGKLPFRPEARVRRW